MSGAEARDEIDERDISVGTFVERSTEYYDRVFENVQRGQTRPWNLNFWALLIPWFWAAQRGIWLVFWLSLALDVLAFVCLMQYVKFAPLLETALADAANNSVLIERYSRWISVYTWCGIIVFVVGRLWVASRANRWYYSQYTRWRISESVNNGVVAKRLVIAVVIMSIIAPITLYRATQLRLDGRACFNQIRAAETVEALLGQYGTGDPIALAATLADNVQDREARMAALDALDELTDAQNSERAALRKEIRDTGRALGTTNAFNAISAKDRFDCAVIDDFPTLARFTPPPEVRYRRVADEEAIGAGEAGATKILIQESAPVEGRRVNTFTYTAEGIDTSINYLRARYATFFDAMTNILRQSLIRVEVAFMQTPWPVVAFLFLALSWAYTNRATTIFVASSLAFLAVFELWQIAMQTMALVVVATAICVFVGLPVGIWMAKNKYFRWFTEPVLDVMQTIPSLSYLVPAVAFFGISQPPAVLATVIFAIPPMVKLTALGILQVPDSTKEAALAFGASERQLLRKVELPMAIPSIMAGLNQTIMLALSMATISAFIGAAGLGALVTESLGDAQAGKGLLAGVAIALVAMMIDRILRGIRASFSRI